MISVKNGVFFVSFSELNMDHPSYKIQNDCQHRNLIVYQESVKSRFVDELVAKESAPYAWDEPNKKRRRLVVEVLPDQDHPLSRAGGTHEIKTIHHVPVDFDQIGYLHRVRLKASLCSQGVDRLLIFEVFANGPTRVLRISEENFQEETEQFTLLAGSESESYPYLHISLRLPGICVSMCNQSPQELLYASLVDVHLDYLISKNESELTLSVDDLQIDNQLYRTPQPVAFVKTSNLFKEDEEEVSSDESPLLKLSLKRNTAIDSIGYIRCLQIHIAECDIAIETKIGFALEQWVLSLYEIFNNMQSSQQSDEKVSGAKQLEQPVIICSDGVLPALPDKKLGETGSDRMVFLEQFNINPILIRLTFTPISDLPKHMQSHWSRRMVFRAAIALARLEHAPLCLNGLRASSAFLTRGNFLSKAIEHFTSISRHQLISQLVGAKVDYVGTQGTLFNDLMSGEEFEDTRAMTRQDRGPNLFRGGFGATSKLSEAGASSIATLSTTDNAYLKQREQGMQSRSENVGDGFLKGVKSLGWGMLKGVTGLVSEPATALSEPEASPSSVGRGILGGVTGLLSKPVVGVLDFVSKTAEGVRNAGTAAVKVSRKRFPRFFSASGVLHSYDAHQSEGALLLYSVAGGAFEHEWYMWHCGLEQARPCTKFLIASSQHLIYLDMSDPDRYADLSKLPFVHLALISAIKPVSSNKILIVGQEHRSNGGHPTQMTLTVQNAQYRDEVVQQAIQQVNNFSINAQSASFRHPRRTLFMEDISGHQLLTPPNNAQPSFSSSSSSSSNSSNSSSSSLSNSSSIQSHTDLTPDYGFVVSLRDIRFIKRQPSGVENGVFIVITCRGGISLCPLHFDASPQQSAPERVATFLWALSKLAYIDRSPTDPFVTSVEFPKPPLLPDSLEGFENDPQQLENAELERVRTVIAPPTTTWMDTFSKMTQYARAATDRVWAFGSADGPIDFEKQQTSSPPLDLLALDDDFEMLSPSNSLSTSGEKERTSAVQSSVETRTSMVNLTHSPTAKRKKLLENYQSPKERGKTISKEEWESWDLSCSSSSSSSSCSSSSSSSCSSKTSMSFKQFRQRVFYSGVDPSIRRSVWKYLLGYWEWGSSPSQRAQVDLEKKRAYEQIKQQWESISDEQASHFAIYRSMIHQIEKDVKRTDRTLQWFKDENSPYIKALDSILRTYGFFNFDLGYVQGMNDLLSPILVVMEGSEHEAFWCFKAVMDRAAPNFYREQKALKHQMKQLCDILELIDPQLHSYLDDINALGMYFSFRWLLCQFKREFSLDDVLVIWEVFWSNHWDCKQLHLFFALAILQQVRTHIMSESLSFDMLLRYINDLQGKLNREQLLSSMAKLYQKFVALTPNENQRQAILQPFTDKQDMSALLKQRS